LNNISLARFPLKTATRKTLRELGLSPISGIQESPAHINIIPSDHSGFCPDSRSGIGISVFVNDSSTALKSNLLFDEKAPMMFSQTAITGYVPFVAHLISSMIRIA